MKVLGVALILGMGLLTACSSDEEQGDEKLENDMNESSESENSANSQEGGGENAEGSSENAEESGDSEGEGDSASNEAAADEAAPPEDPGDAPPAEALPEPAPPEASAPMDAAPAATADAGGGAAAAPAAPAGGAPAAAPPPGLWDPNRLVRFINADGTPIYATAQAGAQTVGTLRKGDHVMVLMQGEWAMVSESAYIQGTALSAKAEPRTMGENEWIPPSE